MGDAACPELYGFSSFTLLMRSPRNRHILACDIALLEERNSTAFTFGMDGLRWRSHRVALQQLVRARTSFAVAFGSCSFREPVDDLQELALL